MPRIRPERVVVLLGALLLASTLAAFAVFKASGRSGWEPAASWLLFAALAVMLTPLAGFAVLRLWERFGCRT